MSEASSFESLLHRALSPVDPPEDLGVRLEGALLSLTTSAAEELESWELSAMRDPRNWARPAAAIAVGGSAGIALVLLRARRSASSRHSVMPGVREAAERTAGDLRKRAARLRGS
ncbi:MAG TPA: hypothetical protein VHS55_01225 [Solirubrobacteraceae bacterium]|jgi:hypothetical protein|nr:hypothetical protein [Solirubrobacteraceae bacterium]